MLNGQPHPPQAARLFRVTACLLLGWSVTSCIQPASRVSRIDKATSAQSRPSPGTSAPSEHWVKLTYPNDFVPEDMVPPREFSELEKQAYRRGYEAGWKAFAARWRYASQCGTEEGNGIKCRDDASPFQQGFEMGQVWASRAADMLVIQELDRILVSPPASSAPVARPAQ